MDIGAISMEKIISYLIMDFIKVAGDLLKGLKSLSQIAISFLKLMKEPMKMLILILKIQIL